MIRGVLAAVFTGRGKAYSEGDAPDPGCCPHEYGGAARGPEFLALGPVPEETVMSIALWIIPVRGPGRATVGCQSGWASR
jgi:hypothetical protein